MKVNRREFLVSSAAAAASASVLAGTPLKEALAGKTDSAVEARYWKPIEDKAVRCQLCNRGCEVPDGSRGYCQVRENRGGTYYTLVHSRPCALHNDPVEKKPFFHYRPGTHTMSIATAGCCFSCKFCQNWEISQAAPEEVDSIQLSPQSLIDKAFEEGSKSVSFTYNEPTVFYEYMFDCAKLASKNGLGAAVISNGYIRKEPVRELLKYVDAYRVDLKSFREEFYSSVTNAHLKPVLKTLKTIRKSGVWLEIINLIVPTMNDSKEEITAKCRWVVQELGPDVPMHFNRFHPLYKLTNLPPTPVETLERCHDIARECGVNFPYIGNVLGHKGESTYCPTSGKLLIERMGFEIIKNHIKDGKCPCCGKPVPGKWS